jgi:hypothetical protein
VRIELKDLMVVATCVVVFAVSVTLTAENPHHHDPDHRVLAGPFGPPPFGKIAKALDLPTDRVRVAFIEVGPPGKGQHLPPSEQQLAEHSQKLATVLHVPVDRLRSVLEACRPLPQ